MSINASDSRIVPELEDLEPANLKELAQLEHPELYDLKRLMVRYYNTSSPGMRPAIREELTHMLLSNEFPYVHPGTPLEQFLRYKKADKAFKGRKFDCDNSNATCDLTFQLYRCLWGWPDALMSDAEAENRPTQGRLSSWGEMAFGGDTMNSVATILGMYRRAFPSRDPEPVFSVFAQLTHCIGNLVLVPYGFNRGRYGKTKDFWDASLAWLRRDGFQAMRPENFTKYINFFFLWDYVSLDGNGGYQVKPLFGGRERLDRESRWAEIKPEEIPGFCDTVCNCIRRRGKFMALLLYLNTHQELKSVSNSFRAYLQGEDFLLRAHENGFQVACNQLKRVLAEADADPVLVRRLAGI